MLHAEPHDPDMSVVSNQFKRNKLLQKNMTNAHVIIIQILIYTVCLFYFCCTVAITIEAAYKIRKSSTLFEVYWKNEFLTCRKCDLI